MPSLTSRTSWKTYVRAHATALNRGVHRGAFHTTFLMEMFVCVCVFVQMEGVLSDAKNQLTSEILRRVEMENQVQTLKEQLDLQRNISEQVLHSRPRCHREHTRSPLLEKRP